MRAGAASAPRLNATSTCWLLPCCVLRFFFGGGVAVLRASGLLEVEGVFLGSLSVQHASPRTKRSGRTFFKASQLEDGADPGLEVTGRDMRANAETGPRLQLQCTST